jgi:epoxyqueuosine reductase
VGLNSEIELELKQKGASLVGFADISGLPTEARSGLNYAISIAVALDAAIIKGIAGGPTQAYYDEYKRANELLANLCKGTVGRLKRDGNEAFTTAPTVSAKGLDPKTLATALPHKTAATRAGLGWIGKSALLITKDYGAAVRLGTVITNAKFEVAKPVDSSQCGICDRCVTHCPAKAIIGQNWGFETKREEIFDAHKCWDVAKRLANSAGIPNVICGICINVCPWTQKYITRKNTWEKTWYAETF